jgi:flagellar biosynthetic protein FlhB
MAETDFTKNFEKTEPPTPRKLEKARLEGTVFSSPELIYAALWLFAACFLIIYLPHWIKEGSNLMVWSLSNLSEATVSPEWVSEASVFLGQRALWCFLPFFGLLIILTFAFHFIQTGPVISLKPFSRGRESMNAARNWSLMWRQDTWVKFILQILKYSILLTMLGFLAKRVYESFWNIPETSASAFTQSLMNMSISFLVQVVVVLFVFAALDFWYGRSRFVTSLKMSRQEIQEELKEMEADKTIRRAAMDTWKRLSRAQHLSFLKEAQVLVVDGQKRAVVLGKRTTDQAWIVLAKLSESELAQYRQQLEKNHLDVIESAELTDSLFQKSKMRQALPLNLKIELGEWLLKLHRKNL